MKYIDGLIHPSRDYEEYQLRKWYKSLPQMGCVMGGHAVLLMYNHKSPKKSYILREQL